MKKILAILAVAVMPLVAHAQFEQGKMYANASLTGLNLSYSGAEELSLGVQGQAGYFVADNILLYGLAGWNHQGSPKSDQIELGAGGRYYILQNGIFLGANVKYAHGAGGYNDVMPGVEVGYAFFISRTVTIEPSVYYQQSFKKHSDYSKIGLRIGFGIYL
ncbi:MAG: outer membrane beta-barrel protein [Prevotella sp.]|nr:outer membrane beta-barrel protein [Prevotella sp.]